MIILKLLISDLSYTSIFEGELTIPYATYVPMIGEHIILTNAQTLKLKEKIFTSPALKKSYILLTLLK